MKLLEYLSFIFIILISCQGAPKTENKYYETGELKQKITQDSVNCYMYTEYYKNGNMRLEGRICNEIKEGKWKEWYIDGKLKWEGYFDDSIRVINYNKQTPKITFYGSPDNIYPINFTQRYKIKTNMPCVEPNMTEITARGKCILRKLRRSFLRNRPARKVAETKQNVVIPNGRTIEDNEKELL